MAKRINKKELSIILSEKINLDESNCKIVLDIFERHFFIDKKSKDNIIEDLIKELNISSEVAQNIYNETKSIISSTIKDRIKHPFK